MTTSNGQREHQPDTIPLSTAEAFGQSAIVARYPRLGAILATSTEEQQAHQTEANRLSSEFERHAETRRCIEAVANLKSVLGARYSPERCALESFQVGNAKQQAAIDRLKAFDVASGRGLVLYGTVGTGKDHLLAAMLYRACRAGKPAGWINGPELFGRFRDGFDSEAKEETILARFVRPAVLGISDPVPQVGDASSWRTEILYRVIELRYRELKPTWMTINAISPDDADAKLSAPNFDRLRDDAELIPCFWPSYREMQK